MKLEIELDLNQIDYDAINKQIQDKIAEMDLHKEYVIDQKINSKIKEEVDNEVNNYFRSGAWGGLNTNSTREIKDEISNNLRELVKPHINRVFNQLSQEDLDKIISEMLPIVLVGLISDNLRNTLISYYQQSSEAIISEAAMRIKSMLGGL